MPVSVTLQIARRWWSPLPRSYRRTLALSWKEVPVKRRLHLLRILLENPGTIGRLKALRSLICIPKYVFNNLGDSQLHSLLSQADFLKAEEWPEPIVSMVKWWGEQWYMPNEYGLNLTALEYALANEAFDRFVNSGDQQHLNLLCGTLLREADTDNARVLRTGDMRVPLESRAQADTRAALFAFMPDHLRIMVLLYFCGVKKFVHDRYQLLFAKPDSDDDGSSTAPTLGWWSVFFDLAKSGPFGTDIDMVLQKPIHDICVYLVDQKNKAEREAMRRQLDNPKFGQHD